GSVPPNRTLEPAGTTALLGVSVSATELLKNSPVSTWLGSSTSNVELFVNVTTKSDPSTSNVADAARGGTEALTVNAVADATPANAPATNPAEPQLRARAHMFLSPPENRFPNGCYLSPFATETYHSIYGIVLISPR